MVPTNLTSAGLGKSKSNRIHCKDATAPIISNLAMVYFSLETNICLLTQLTLC